DGRVHGLAGQQQTDGPAHRHAAAQDDDVLAVQVDVVPRQELDDARGGAGQRRVDVLLDPQDQVAQVLRVQSVRVLRGIDEAEDPVLVDALRQRQLHDVAGAGGRSEERRVGKGGTGRVA